MATFQKKPEFVEAIRFTDEVFWRYQDTKEPIFGVLTPTGSWHPANRTIGSVGIWLRQERQPFATGTALLGEWIIRHPGGGFESMTDEKFQETYAPVPAPPTRKEEPRRLAPEKLGRLRMGRATPAEQQEAYVRVDFVESDRDRLREQIETHRTWLKACGLQADLVLREFNIQFPPERP